MAVKLKILLAMVGLFALAASAQTGPDTLTVYFRQGKTTIDLNYMGNDSVVAKINSIMRAPNSCPFTAISIIGGASPEGPATLNSRLSRQRAAAVARYFTIPDSLVATTFSGSDWNGLQTRIAEDPDVPFKKEVEAVVADIIDSPDQACPVDVLRNMHNGESYRYLYNKCFPFLRKSEIVLERVGTHTCASAGSDTDSITEVSTGIIPDSINESVETNLIADNAETSVFVADEQRVTASGDYVFALKTNMLYDAALIPNIGVEFPIGKHFSAGGNWMYAWWKNHNRNRHWRIYGGDLFARYWFKDGASELNGHHVGVYGTVLLYQVGFGGNGYISGMPGQNMTGGKPWVGGGVEYGYSLNVHPRLNIDFSLGVGYTSGEQRDYRMIDDCYVWQSSSRKHWFGPTKAEISLVWKIGKLPQNGKSGKEADQ